MPLTIRRATLRDVPAIRRLSQQVWRMPDISGRYETGTLIRFGWGLMALERGRLAGALLAHRTQDGTVHICEVSVAAAARRRGVASALYKELFRMLPRERFLTIVEVRNTPSRALHAKLGFRAVKRVRDPYGVGEGPALILRRPMAARAAAGAPAGTRSGPRASR